MSNTRYIHGKTAEEREPHLWDTIHSLEAKLFIAEHEAREKVSARQGIMESLLHRAIAIAENAIDTHSCGCLECGQEIQKLNNLKSEIK
jgi:hypothetical protein